jgi:hypothetical protein
MVRLFTVAAIVTVAILPRAARAQEPAAVDDRGGVRQRFGISGSFRAGYWSSTRDLDTDSHLGVGMFWLKAARPLSERVSFLFESRTAVRGPIEHGKTDTVVREAFVNLKFGALDIRAGRQIVAWGRADGVNPTDNLTGEDLRLLAPDDDDRRLGATAIRASYYAGDVSVTAVWLPERAPHRFPIPRAPGVSFREVEDRWDPDTWAARVEQTGRAVDWSVSYYRGRDLLPDLAPDAAADSVVLLTYQPVRVIGADLAANVGKFGLRAEAAVVRTGDREGRDPFTKNSFFFLVAGADRTFREHLNVNAQYLHRFVFEYSGNRPTESAGANFVATQQAILSSQTRRVQHGASLRVGYKWLRDTFEAELAAAAWFGPRGATLRPKISYAVSDQWKVIAGAEVFRGDRTSLFGLLRPNSTVFLEVRRAF